MYQFLRLYMHIATLLCYSEATSISLSPLGMVTVCPGGQLSLTCVRMSGSVLFWDVSVPRNMVGTTQRIVQSQGILLSPEFRIGFTEFNVSRTSNSPLISQLLINNVTSELNGLTIYCSEDGDENNAPMIAIINIEYKDDVLGSMDHSLNVTMVNQLLRSDDVTVTFQWPREPGAVYHVNITPPVSHTELTSMEHNIFTMNLTISYDTQYYVNIVSSLCDITITKVLNFVTCNYPPTQLLHRPVTVVSGSQDSPPIEGQFITYTCPPGFTLNGPNSSVCTRNREWEPDPGEVDCIVDLDCELPFVDRNIKLHSISTVEGLVLILTCDEVMLTVTCHSNGSWIPDPSGFIQACSPFATVTTSQGLNNKTSEDSLLLIILIPSTIFSTILLMLFIITLCVIIRMCVAKKNSEDPKQQPTYEEIVQCRKDIPMDENTAYGHIK